MAKPSDDVIAVIKDAVDIVQLIGEYIRVEAFGAKYRALCPFHDDRKPSLQIDPQFQNYRCWACGAKGDVFKFLQDYEKISFTEAKERLASRAGIVLKTGGSGSAESKDVVLKVLAWAAKEFQNSLFDHHQPATARQYLTERGFSEQTLREFGLGFAPAEFQWLRDRARRAGFDDQALIRAGLAKTSEKGSVYDTFRARVMIPIRETSGRVIGFGGRLVPALDDGRGPKYLNSPATNVYNKSRVLYGLEVAAEVVRSRSGPAANPIIVMEGYMDCLMAYQAGLRHCVATCGTALTAEHIKRLRGYTDRVVLMFDGDAAGRKAASESTALFLESEVDVRLCLLPEEYDPCDFIREKGVEELGALIESSPDAIDFVIGESSGRREGLTDQSRAMDHVLETLAAMPPILRSQQQQRIDLALNRVAESFRVDEGTVRSRLEEIRRDRRLRTRVDRAESHAPTLPFPARERQVLELAVMMPSRAGALAEVMPTEEIRHPDLKVIMETCCRLFEEMREDATTEALRERLDDDRLDALVHELTESCPKGEAFENSLQEICRELGEERRRRELARSARLAPDADQEDHLAVLREIMRRSQS